MEKKTVIMVLESLEANYRQKMTEREKALNVRNWMAILKDVTDEQGLKGLRKIMEDPGEFMPPVGKFKQMCLTGSGSKSLEDDGAQAWALVMQNLNSSIAPVFKDTAIAETINKLGGWVTFCYSITDENHDFKRRDFISIYVMCRNQKQEFLPMPNGTTTFFQGGKQVAHHRFLGRWSSNDKEEVVKLIKEKRQTDKRIAGILGFDA